MRKDLMRTYFCKTLLIGAAICFIAASGLSAQTAVEPQATSAAPERMDVAVLYSTTMSNAVGGSSFWLQGGGVQVHGLIYRGFGVAGELSDVRRGNIQSSGVGLNLFTATLGPRYTWQPAHTRYSFYGHALLGGAGGFHSEFPMYYG